MKITLQQKLQNITDINLCKKVVHSLYVKVSSWRVRCLNNPKIYDARSKDNHKICTQVVVHLLEGMYN